MCTRNLDPLEEIDMSESDPATHFRRGMALVEARRPEDAISSFKKATDIAGDQPVAWVAWMNMGNTVTQFLSDPERAVPLFKKASQLDPSQPQPHFNLGNELTRLDRLTEASTSYRTALRCQPDWPEPLAALIATEQKLMALDTWPIAQWHSRETFRRHGAAAIEQPFLAAFQFPFSPAQTLMVMRARAHDLLRSAPPARQRRRRGSSHVVLHSEGLLRIAVAHERPFKGSQVSPHFASMFHLWRRSNSQQSYVHPSMFSLAQRPPPSEEPTEAGGWSIANEWIEVEREGRVEVLQGDDDEALSRCVFLTNLRAT